ncbi:hypothetical protein [Flavobacterium sp.]|uniref:hypothetical protein n=1 Tax=Flavobacterium sp. TaxID=239 RepID=UPI003A909CF1
MQGNPQIYEYFGLEKPLVQQVESTEELSAMEKYVPYSINENDGIRLYVSYNKREEVQDHACSFSSNDVITLKEGKIKIIDHFATEVKKAIEEVGGTIVLPADIIFALPEDYYCNIPNIFHWDKDAQKLVNQTVDGFRLMLNKMVLRKGNEVMSISLSWNVEDKEVVLSFMGHVSDLNYWLQSFQSIPVSRAEFKSWLESQAVYIKSKGINTACPVMSEIVCGDGMLFFKRRLVQNDAKLTFPDQNDFNKSELEFDDDKEDLIHAINQNQITSCTHDSSTKDDLYGFRIGLSSEPSLCD